MNLKHYQKAAKLRYKKQSINMTLQYASDLHLEFPENKDFLRKNPIQPKGDILLLAGDIVPFAVLEQHDDFFNYVSDNFEQTYWIAGNHEFYHFNLAEKSSVLHEKIKANVHVVNNISVELENIRILFSTLWSYINPKNQAAVYLRLNDFRLIKNGNAKLTPADYNEQHAECFRFLETELSQKSDKKTVVVTHHVPTMKNYPPEYLGDALNDAFTIELKDLMLKTEPGYWIYGHSHRNTPAFEIGKTKLLTNQLGYVRYGKSASYSDKAYITI